MATVEEALVTISSQLGELTKKVDETVGAVSASRAEGQSRGREIERVASDLSALAGRVEVLEKKPDPPDHGDHATTSALESLQRSVEAKEGEQQRVNKGMCKALGLNYADLAAPQASLTATQAIRRIRAEDPRVTLKSVSRNQTIGGAIALLIQLAILARIFFQH